ncbi:hypothetical protein VTL71DRAFT_7507 [Oculimacula yallundae]|uniref:Uncharacterized protein n=1 Tax=Oculimacula yallundae TaxID=86028 RepID=A0ABR4BVZ4_9HELO
MGIAKIPHQLRTAMHHHSQNQDVKRMPLLPQASCILALEMGLSDHQLANIFWILYSSISSAPWARSELIAMKTPIIADLLDVSPRTTSLVLTPFVAMSTLALARDAWGELLSTAISSFAVGPEAECQLEAKKSQFVGNTNTDDHYPRRVESHEL